MSDVPSHILAVSEPNKALGEQVISVLALAKALENIPVEAKKSWADLVDEELDNQPVPSPTIVSDFINENNVEQLIEVISKVWIESETRSLEIKLDQDLVSESCAKLFIKIRKTFPNTRWPLSQAFIFVQHLQPFDPQVQEDLKQLSSTMADNSEVFDDNTLTEEQKQQLDKIKDLEADDRTDLIHDITIITCRKTPSQAVYEKLVDYMVECEGWDMTERDICTLFLALSNSYTNYIRAQEKAITAYCLGLSMQIMKDRVKMKADVARGMKRSVLQYTIFFGIVARKADAMNGFWLALQKFQTFFDELRDIVLEPQSDRVEKAIVLSYLDIVFNLALKPGQNLVLVQNPHVMDFLFSSLKNDSETVQKAALHAITPILEGSPLAALGKNRVNALLRQLEVHMNKTWLIKSGDLIRVIGLLSTQLNEKLKKLNVVAKYAPILNSRYDGKEVQKDLLRCLQTMTLARAGDNSNAIEGIAMVHAVPGAFENVIRIVKHAKEGTDIFLMSFRLLSQLIIPNTAIINKIYETSVQKDVLRALLSDQGLHTEAGKRSVYAVERSDLIIPIVYFVSQLVNCTFEQAQIDELINDFYAPVLERLKTAQEETLVAYGLICLSLLARCKDEINIKQVISCATAKTKDGETVLDVLTTEKFIFSPRLNIRCNVFKVFSSLSVTPSTANLLVDYGLVPPLVQMAMFDTTACFQGEPCSPQFHALTTLNNIVLFNNTAKQTLRATPMFLMTLQQSTVAASQHPVRRAKSTLVANVVREGSAKADKAQEVIDNALKHEKAFFNKNPQYIIKNTIKKEIVVPDDLFNQTLATKGPVCNNPTCPNKQKPNIKILNCARCGKVGYCSKECQQAMWPIHKNYCKK